MAHMIEAAKSGRSNCRSCKQPIGKGDMRLGEEVPNQFAEGEFTYSWHHLPCAAQKRPSALKQALEVTDVEVADKDELLKTCEASAKKEKPTTLPYAEYAPTARSSCVACSEKIEKGDLRVAVAAEADPGALFARRSAAYLHTACAPEHTGEEAATLFESIQANSPNLGQEDLQRLETEMLEAVG